MGHHISAGKSTCKPRWVHLGLMSHRWSSLMLQRTETHNLVDSLRESLANRLWCMLCMQELWSGVSRWSSSLEIALLQERPEGLEKFSAAGNDHQRSATQPALLPLLHTSWVNNKAEIERTRESWFRKLINLQPSCSFVITSTGSQYLSHKYHYRAGASSLKVAWPKSTYRT